MELTLYCVPPMLTGCAPPSLNWIGIDEGLEAKEPGRTVVEGTGMFWQAIFARTVIGPPAFPPILVLPTRQPSACMKVSPEPPRAILIASDNDLSMVPLPPP